MENLTINTAIELLTNRRAKDAEENRALYDGDHLHLGKENTYGGYSGILPPSSAPNYEFLMNWLQRIFTAANLVKSGVTRNVDAVLSAEPDWDMVFPEGTGETTRDALKKEVDEALIKWWDDDDVLKNTLREIGQYALLEGELYLRPIISVSERTESGSVPTRATLAEAFELIEFEVVTADKGGIFTDKQTGRKYSYCYIQIGSTKEIEVSWVGADGLTYLKILRDDDLKQWASQNFASIAAYMDGKPNPATAAQGIDLGGRLYLHRITRDKLITEPARSLQRSVNYALTTMNKNLNIAGSRETGYGNTQKPKKVVVTKDASGNIISTKEEDAPLTKGVDNANFFVGIPVYSPDKTDGQGNPILVDYKQPVQFIVDPVAVDTFVKAFEVYRELFLEEIYQAHILGSNLTVSGKSKQESRSDFHKSAKATALCINPAGRYILDVTLKLGASICSRAADFAGVRFSFKCQLTVGAVDTEEIKQEAEDLKSGFTTLYLYLVKKGHDDPDAVIEQLKSADDYVLSQLEKALAVYKEAGNRIPLETIINLLPITEDDKKKIIDSIVPGDETNNLGVSE